MKTTPGPWTVHGTFEPYEIWAEPSNELVAETSVNEVKSAETSEANARLISAAPTLLAACVAVLEALERNLAPDCLPETRQMLRDAIARAEQS